MNKPNAVNRGPRQFTKSELNRVGVTLNYDSNSHLKCQICDHEWWPMTPGLGRRMHRNYWKCPNRCNEIGTDLHEARRSNHKFFEYSE